MFAPEASSTTSAMPKQFNVPPPLNAILSSTNPATKRTCPGEKIHTLPGTGIFLEMEKGHCTPVLTGAQAVCMPTKLSEAAIKCSRYVLSQMRPSLKQILGPRRKKKLLTPSSLEALCLNAPACSLEPTIRAQSSRLHKLTFLYWRGGGVLRCMGQIGYL